MASPLTRADESSQETSAFLGKAGPLVLARLFTAGLTVAIPLVLARRLPLAEYGTYKQLWLIAQTLYYVLSFGVPQSLYFFVPRTTEKRPFFGQTLTFLTLAGGLACGLLFLFAGSVGHAFSNPGIVEHRLALGIYAGCLLGSFPLEISLTSQGRTKQSAVAYLVSDGTRALAMTVPVLLGFGLNGLMTAMATFAVVRLAVAWVVALKGTEGPFWSWRLLGKQLAYAAPFGLAMAVAIPQQYAHQYAVSALVSPEAFAIYAVGCFQLPLVDLLYTPTSEVLMVRIGELEKAGRVHEALFAFRQSVAKLALVFIPLAAFLFAAAPEFIGAAFGAKFLSAVPIFRISVIGVLLAIAPMDGVLRARNLTGHILMSYVAKAVVTVPLVFFGVRHFGLLGGIASWAIAESVGKATLFLKIPAALSTRSVRRTMVEVMPWRELGKAGAAAACGALGVVLARAAASAASSLPSGLAGRLLPLAGSGVLFAVAYLGILWMTGIRPTVVMATFWRRRTA